MIEVQLEAAQQALVAKDKDNIAVSAQALEHLVLNDPEILAMNGELQEIRMHLREFEKTSKNPTDLDPVKNLLKRRTELGNSLTKRKQELRKQRTEDLQAGQLAAPRCHHRLCRRTEKAADAGRPAPKTTGCRTCGNGEVRRSALNLEFGRGDGTCRRSF